MKAWHLIALAAVVVAVVWWRWRKAAAASAIDPATGGVRLPRTGIYGPPAPAGTSIFSVPASKAASQAYGPLAPLGSIVTGAGNTTVPDYSDADFGDTVA